MVLFLALAVAAPSEPAFATPLDIPIPKNLNGEDLFSMESEGGDFRSIFPVTGLCNSAESQPISLPADDAPHQDTYHEYWWWFGHAKARDGRELAFMAIFYSKPWANVQQVQFAITDLSDGSFHQSAEVMSGRLPKPKQGFRLPGQDFAAEGADGRDRLRLEVDGYRMDLALRPTKPAVRHYGDGHLSGLCQNVDTYSRPRMRVKGSLQDGDEAVRIRGTSTFERMWGFWPVAPIPNWLHMNLQLDDGRDLLVFFVRAVEGDETLASLHTGWISNRRGNVTTLHRGDFNMEPGREWRRDAGCAYPVEWDVTVKGLKLQVTPYVDEAEMRTTSSPLSLALFPEFPAIWDGATRVRGDAKGVGWNDLGHPCFL